MGPLRITNGYDRLADERFALEVDLLISYMENNPSFPSPRPALADMTAELKTFRDRVQKAKNGDRMEALLKNDQRRKLLQMVYSLSYYVLYAANGNRTIAASSGFVLAKEQKPAQPIAKPHNLQVQNSLQTGIMEVSVNAVPGAMAYLYQYTTNPDMSEESWQSVTSTSSKCKLKGLKPGLLYYVRVAVVGRKNQKLYSDVQWRMAA